MLQLSWFYITYLSARGVKKSDIIFSADVTSQIMLKNVILTLRMHLSIAWGFLLAKPGTVETVQHRLQI